MRLVVTLTSEVLDSSKYLTDQQALSGRVSQAI